MYRTRENHLHRTQYIRFTIVFQIFNNNLYLHCILFFFNQFPYFTSYFVFDQQHVFVFYHNILLTICISSIFILYVSLFRFISFSCFTSYCLSFVFYMYIYYTYIAQQFPKDIKLRHINSRSRVYNRICRQRDLEIITT